MFSAKLLVWPAVVVILLAVGFVGTAAAGNSKSPAFDPQLIAPTQVSLTPAESWSCIFDQHELTALLMNDSGRVNNGRIEFFLNRFPAAVGDIAQVDGHSPTKMTNTFAIVQTASNGEASATLVATHPGDTDVTVFAPGILNDSDHKVFGVVHWVDGCPSFPSDTENPIGTPHAMSVSVLQVSDGDPVQDTSVRWTIIDDDPDARFLGGLGDGNVITTTTDASGVASVTLQQVAGNIGDNSVLIEVLSQDGKTMFSRTMVKQWKSAVLELSATGPARIDLLASATYDITVSNSGDLTATGTELTAMLPTGLEFISATNRATVSGSNVTWNLGLVRMGGSVPVTLTTRGIQTGDQIIRYRATSDGVPSAGASTTTEVTTTSITVEKTGRAAFSVGNQATYTLTASNSGDVLLTGVTITDTIVVGMSYVSSTLAGTVSASGDTVTWDIGDLAVGASASVLVTLQGDRTGSITNTASASADQGVSDTATLNISIQPAPGSTIRITDSFDPVSETQEVDFTVTVSNQGRSPMTSVRVVVPIPTEFTIVSTSSDSPQATIISDRRTVTVDLDGSLATGNSFSFAIKVSANELLGTEIRQDTVTTATMTYSEFSEPVSTDEGTTVIEQ